MQGLFFKICECSRGRCRSQPLRMWVCRLPVHIGPAVCTVFTKISGEFAAAQGADRVVGPYMTPANSCCPANFECKAFLPQSFKGNYYQIWCTVTGGAYISAPFLPHLFRQGGKDGAVGGASETLCWFAAWVCPRRIHKTAPFRSNGAVHAYMGGGSYSAEMR